MDDPWETLEGFFAERADFLRVGLQPAAEGSWDVVLRLDGTYFTCELARDAAAYFARELGRLLALPLAACQPHVRLMETEHARFAVEVEAPGGFIENLPVQGFDWAGRPLIRNAAGELVTATELSNEGEPNAA